MAKRDFRLYVKMEITSPIRSRRGFYVLTPFLGAASFIIVMAVAAFVGSENEQSLKALSTTYEIDDLVFSGRALNCDVSLVYMHNRLQMILYEYTEGSLRNSLESAFRDTMENIPPAYRDAFQTQYTDAACFEYRPDPAATPAAIYLLKFRDETYLLSPDGTTEILPDISGYGLKCISTEPPATVLIDFETTWHFLDASNICDMMTTLC